MLQKDKKNGCQYLYHANVKSISVKRSQCQASVSFFNLYPTVCFVLDGLQTRRSKRRRAGGRLSTNKRAKSAEPPSTAGGVVCPGCNTSLINQGAGKHALTY